MARSDRSNRDKPMYLRVPKDLWKYLRMSAAKEEITVCDIVNDVLSAYRKKKEKQLTTNDSMIS